MRNIWKRIVGIIFSLQEFGVGEDSVFQNPEKACEGKCLLYFSKEKQDEECLSSDIFYFFYFIKGKVKIPHKVWGCFIIFCVVIVKPLWFSFVWISWYLVCEKQEYFSFLVKSMIQFRLFFPFFSAISLWLEVVKYLRITTISASIFCSLHMCPFPLSFRHHSPSFSHKVKPLLWAVTGYLYLWYLYFASSVYNFSLSDLISISIFFF